MDYAKAFRIVRSARGMSQKELAQRSHLDASYISLLESGRRVPSAATIEALGTALEIPVYLLSLLASEKQDLRDISEADAESLGRHLLNLVTSIPKAAVPNEPPADPDHEPHPVRAPPRRRPRH